MKRVLLAACAVLALTGAAHARAPNKTNPLIPESMYGFWCTHGLNPTYGRLCHHDINRQIEVYPEGFDISDANNNTTRCKLTSTDRWRGRYAFEFDCTDDTNKPTYRYELWAIKDGKLVIEEAGE